MAHLERADLSSSDVHLPHADSPEELQRQLRDTFFNFLTYTSPQLISLLEQSVALQVELEASGRKDEASDMAARIKNIKDRLSHKDDVVLGSDGEYELIKPN